MIDEPALLATGQVANDGQPASPSSVDGVSMFKRSGPGKTLLILLATCLSTMAEVRSATTDRASATTRFEHQSPEYERRFDELLMQQAILDVDGLAEYLDVEHDAVEFGLSGTVQLVCGNAVGSANLVNGLQTIVTVAHIREPTTDSERLSRCYVRHNGRGFGLRTDPDSYQCGRNGVSLSKRKNFSGNEWCVYTLRRSLPDELNYYVVSHPQPIFGELGIDDEGLAWELSTTAIFYGRLIPGEITAGVSNCFAVHARQFGPSIRSEWQLPPPFLSNAIDSGIQHIAFCTGVPGNSGGAVTRAITPETLLQHRELAGIIVGGSKVVERPAMGPNVKLTYKNVPLLSFAPVEGRLADAIIALSLPGLIEHRLDELGCDPGRVDGVWHRRSRNALRAFDRAANTKLAANPVSLGTWETLRDSVGIRCARER